MKIRELSGRTRIAVMIRDFCWKCRWSVLGVNYPWLGWKCGKTWKIYGNIKKHLKIIHGRSNHSWHELFLGVSLYFCKSSPFFHIFNQKSLKLCNYLGVATFYQERLIDFLNVEKNLEPREIYKDVKFDDKKWFVGES